MIAIVISILMFVGMLVLLEVGYRRGKRWQVLGEAGRSGAGVVEAAVFTLLGLLLGFQFAGASGRLEARRQIIIQEANDIGTAYLRLELLQPQDQQPLRELFKKYTDARIRAFPQDFDLQSHDQNLADSLAIQQQIWKQSVAAAGRSTDPRATMLLIPALNDMIDIATTREVSIWTHAPLLILFLLAGLALLSALLAGHAMSGAPRRHIMHSVVFAFVTAVALYVVIDMEFPRIGLIRVGAADQAMIDTRKSME